jgi:hypothetical protein
MYCCILNHKSAYKGISSKEIILQYASFMPITLIVWPNAARVLAIQEPQLLPNTGPLTWANVVQAVLDWVLCTLQLVLIIDC